MPVNIKNSNLSNNGEYGAFIGRDVQVDIDGLEASHNQRSGVHYEGMSNTTAAAEAEKPSWWSRFRSETSVKLSVGIVSALILALVAFLWHRYVS